MVVVVFSSVVDAAGGLTMIVLFSDLAGGVTMVVFFSITSTGGGDVLT